jgi:quercetin dioxygenase-like cupin family protein
MSNKVDLAITARRVPPIDMNVVYTSANSEKFNPGRRVEIKYRDLGVEKATKGEMRAEVMQIAEGFESSRPTGWHYHECDIQFLMMVKGWVKIQIADEGVYTLRDGDTLMIPGGVVHQELCSSSPMELLEISIPAKLGTVNVEAPAHAVETDAAA